MTTLSDKQRAVLAALADGEARIEYEIGRKVRRWPGGYAAPAYFYGYLRVLVAHELLTREKIGGSYAQWTITDAGRRVLETA